MGRPLQPPLAGRSRLPPPQHPRVRRSCRRCLGSAACPTGCSVHGGQGIALRGCHPTQPPGLELVRHDTFHPSESALPCPGWEPVLSLTTPTACSTWGCWHRQWGGETWSPSVPAASGTETPVAALLRPHGSPCMAPITPWGTITPALSPAWLWGHTHPVCSRTGALLVASSPRRTPESSSCAASAHPHTHTVPSPCSPGSHVNILLGAAPRHATAPSIPASLFPAAPFHRPAARWSSSTRSL